MNNKNKGNAFEREICTTLSKWWTGGDSDCVFWRTASSGGRATQRTKRGSTTKNHYGDITATDPIGQPLLDVVTLELKRGYSSCSIADLLDKPNKSAPTWYEKWILFDKKIHNFLSKLSPDISSEQFLFYIVKFRIRKNF